MNRASCLLACLLAAVGVVGAAQAASDAEAIRSARAASNAGIAAHDAAVAAAHLAEDARVLGSGGGLLEGAPSMRQAFAQSFADPAFVTYVRIPAAVEVKGRIAAETGHWRGVWRDRELSGPYLARWEMTSAGWRARSETYVPTACKGPACPK